ncbi:pyridoxine 5'-phosphate synthase [Aurantivibrio plasticivorans]
MPIALSVNLNKIALIRNSREGNYPSVVEFGRIALEAGADGLTVHPRPDQRHIRPTDVTALASLVSEYPNCEFNIEGNPFAEPQGSYPGLLELVKETSPHQCTLVPDSNDQLTSDHGFDLSKDANRLLPIIEELHEMGVRVSLFMDPDPDQIARAKALGVARIELYTGPYAAQWSADNDSSDTLYTRYRQAAEFAGEQGIEVNAGHDLNLENLPQFATIPGLKEVSIGHALTVDALRFGMRPAVERYLTICR